MLPEIVDEAKIHSFKFWFSDRIQEGMNYRGELFCRLYTADVSERAKVFQTACRLGQRGASLVLTLSDKQCSLWGNLRSSSVAALALDNLTASSELDLASWVDAVSTEDT
ncbi:MAG: hypothetical protein ACTS2F_01440 [Thainema sp.]